MPLRFRFLPLLFLFASAAPAAAQAPLPVHVGGRAVEEADGAWRFGWPGTYFESRFRGTGVSVAVESDTEYMRVRIDGREHAVLVRPGTARLAITGLSEGEHVVRLDKMTESQSGGGRFLGFFPEVGAVALDPPVRARRIEFIGDSYTVGYGNTAPGRTCTPDEVHDTTDTTRAFGPLLAARLDADYRINAYSGFGIVRNYGGSSAELSLPAIYPRLVPDDPDRIETAGDGWRPQLVVVNLGTNDFSTPLGPGERWPDQAALRADYRARYAEFVRGLMARRPGAYFILMGSDAFIADVEQVAAALASDRIATLPFGELDRDGCDWHPGLADHVALADLLARTIERIDGLWQTP